MKKLEGYRTYILSGLAIVAVIAASQNWIDQNALQMILAILGFGSIAALRSGVSRSKK